MLQFLVGFTLGNVVGMYLAQNYEFGDQDALPETDRNDVPNISKKIEEFKRDVEAKKKPPGS